MERRSCIALVLSGGAVRGGAHVGVLKVLERSGIRPDFIVGTSVGALVGAAFANGVSASDLESLMGRQKWSRLVRPTLRLRTALFEIEPIRRILREEVGLRTFDDLEIPFAAIACDIATGESVTLDEGDLTSAVLASSALPGIFPSQPWKERFLVDGGVVNNLPIDVARGSEASVILAVDLLEMSPSASAAPPRSLFETWQRSLHFMIRRTYPPLHSSDILLVPSLAEMSFTDFGEIPELIRRGEEAATVALPEILGALSVQAR